MNKVMLPMVLVLVTHIGMMVRNGLKHNKKLVYNKRRYSMYTMPMVLVLVIEPHTPAQTF
jgi:hypothetical protein